MSIARPQYCWIICRDTSTSRSPGLEFSIATLRIKWYDAVDHTTGWTFNRAQYFRATNILVMRTAANDP